MVIHGDSDVSSVDKLVTVACALDKCKQDLLPRTFYIMPVRVSSSVQVPLIVDKTLSSASASLVVQLVAVALKTAPA